MEQTSFFELNQPEYTDPVDIDKLNDNMTKIDSALFAGLCKKKVLANEIGDGTQVGSPKAWQPYFEIKNPNDSAVVVTDRSFSSTITIAAGGSHRVYIGSLYPMNFIASDGMAVEYSYFVNVEEVIGELEVISGLYKKSLVANHMGNSDPSLREYAKAPWFEITNNNAFDVEVTDRNIDSELPESTFTIGAGKTYRKYITSDYYMNFFVNHQYDLTFTWFVDMQTVIEDLETRVAALEAAAE